MVMILRWVGSSHCAGEMVEGPRCKNTRQVAELGMALKAFHSLAIARCYEDLVTV